MVEHVTRFALFQHLPFLIANKHVFSFGIYQALRMQVRLESRQCADK